MRIELFDSEGNKYTVAFEGQMDRAKALKVLDLAELLGGMPEGTNDNHPTSAGPEVEGTKYDKVRAVIQKHLPLIWFTSRDVQAFYEQESKEPISLSTVATYLSRMTAKSLVMKSGGQNSLRYRLPPSIQEAVAKP